MNHSEENHRAPSLVNAIRIPIAVLCMTAGFLWWIESNYFALTGKTFRVVYLVSEGIVVVAAVWLVFVLIDVLTEYIRYRTSQTGRELDASLAAFIRTSLKVLIAFTAVVVVLSNLGYNVTGLVAGLGIGGLAIALAAQDTLSNVFGSMTIFMDRPFKLGDYIIIGETEGIVEQVGFRSTRIRTFYNSLVVIPNNEMVKIRIDNMGMRDYRRTKTKISVSYQTPPEKMEAFCAGIRELIRENPHINSDMFAVWFKDFGASSLDVELIVHIKAVDYPTEARVRHKLFLDIMRLARCIGIEFAYPTQTIFMGREVEGPPVFPEAGGIADKTAEEIKLASEMARKIKESGHVDDEMYQSSNIYAEGIFGASDNEDKNND